MRTLAKISLLGGMALAMGYTVAFADEPPINDKPLTEKWFPTEFGADDKAGAINRVTPDKVMKALKLVKQGKSTTIGKRAPLKIHRIMTTSSPRTSKAKR